MIRGTLILAARRCQRTALEGRRFLAGVGVMNRPRIGAPRPERAGPEYPSLLFWGVILRADGVLDRDLELLLDALMDEARPGVELVLRGRSAVLTGKPV